MFVRQLQYLVVLAREKHFARAADICNVSQPALSVAIRNLENELGVAIVRRGGQRFQGFTPEGTRILVWARQALEAINGLKKEASIMSLGNLSGTLTFGIIPTAHLIASLIISYMHTRYPELRYRILTMSATNIISQLSSFEIDVGITYVQNIPLNNLHVSDLYDERYILIAPNRDVIKDRDEISWQEAAKLPMCLLISPMQNRYIIDLAFHEAGVKPNVIVEVDSIFTAYAHVQNSNICSILPNSLLSYYALHSSNSGSIVAISLTPEKRHSIGLISLSNEPCSLSILAAREAVSEINLNF